MEEEGSKPLGMYSIFPPSRSAGVTILVLVYMNSQLEGAGEGGRRHIKRRFYAAKWKAVLFWKIEKRELGVTCHEERPCDADVSEVEENGEILHNWKEKSPPAGRT